MRKINIEINGNEYSVRNLTLGDFYELRQKTYMNDMESAFAVVSRLTNTPQEELQKLKYEHWLELLIAVQTEVNHNNRQALGQSAETRITLGDTEYGLIDIQNCTIGEFMDLDILLSAPDSETNLHKILAIIYRPFVEADGEIVFEEYSNDKSMKRAEEFKEVPLHLAQKTMNFFLLFVKVSLRHMLESSTKEMLMSKIITQEQANRLSNAIFELFEGGLRHLHYSQAKTFWNSTAQQNSTTNLPSTLSLAELIKQKKKNEGQDNFWKNIGLN